MDATEREIYCYLKSRRPKAVPAQDINLHVGRREFRQSPDWARPTLLGMVERGILETDDEGSYRLKPMPRKETEGKRWASPEIGAILKASGKAFDNLITNEDEDEYYDRL